MNKQAMKNRLDKAISEDDKPVIMELIGPIIEDLANRIIAGVLIKNVKLSLSNRGISEKSCEMIAEMAVIRAEEFMQYKAA